MGDAPNRWFVIKRNGGWFYGFRGAAGKYVWPAPSHGFAINSAQHFAVTGERPLPYPNPLHPDV